MTVKTAEMAPSLPCQITTTKRELKSFEKYESKVLTSDRRRWLSSNSRWQPRPFSTCWKGGGREKRSWFTIEEESREPPRRQWPFRCSSFLWWSQKSDLSRVGTWSVWFKQRCSTSRPKPDYLLIDDLLKSEKQAQSEEEANLSFWTNKDTTSTFNFLTLLC